MEIIPAIDLLEGKCVRLNQGNYEQVTQFSSDPVSQAVIWEKEGAKVLHLVDLDGAKTGKPINYPIIRAIKKTISIPIQIGGGIRTIEQAEELLDYGLDRIILGTVAIEKPELVLKLAERHPDRIIVGIDGKNGKVATRGWLEQSNILATDLAKSLSETPIYAIIATDIDTDGTLRGPNVKVMKEMALTSKVPIIASGGIGSITDLLSLLPLEIHGVNGVIVGRALYDGKIVFKDALRALSSEQLQDVPSTNEFIA